MRAWRGLATPAQPIVDQPPPGPRGGTRSGDPGVEHYVGLDVLHQFQRVVEARGWVVSSFFHRHVDTRGLARSMSVMWEFPAAFGGVELDDELVDTGLQPEKPTLLFHGDWVSIYPAGADDGCPLHDARELRWPWNKQGVAEFPAILTQIEDASVPLDLDEFLRCLADGPCADRVRARDEEQRLRAAAGSRLLGSAEAGW